MNIFGGYENPSNMYDFDNLAFDRYDDVYVPNVFEMSTLQFKKYICDLYIMFYRLPKNDYVAATIHFYNANTNPIPKPIRHTISAKLLRNPGDFIHRHLDIERLSTVLLLFGGGLEYHMRHYIDKSNWLWRKWMYDIVIAEHNLPLMRQMFAYSAYRNKVDDSHGEMEMVFAPKVDPDYIYVECVRNDIDVHRLLLQYLWRGRKLPIMMKKNTNMADQEYLYLLGRAPAPKNDKALISHENRKAPYKIVSGYSDIDIICGDGSYH